MISILLDKNIAEAAAHWAAAFGIVVAIAGAIGAYIKYRADRRNNEWDRARQSYASFMDIAIANPEFCPGSWSETAAYDPVFRNKYLWFMARWLWACEEVLTSVPRADERLWKQGFKDVIIEHADYFSSDAGIEETGCYRGPLLLLIQETLAQHSQNKAASGPVAMSLETEIVIQPAVSSDK